jgi:hypothetical protein
VEPAIPDAEGQEGGYLPGVSLDCSGHDLRFSAVLAMAGETANMGHIPLL